MKARVIVTLKNGVLDPQGQATEHALNALGYDGVNSVRMGKVFDLEFSTPKTESDIASMCEKLLANTVIERFDIQIVE